MRHIFLILSALFLFNGAHANNSASDILKEVLANIENRNPYKVEIEVVYSGDSVLGFYEVDKSDYYISVDHQELYGNASVKYEVFNSRKEVVIDSVTPDYNGNILSNPATAFSAIRDYFSAELLLDYNGVMILELKPIEASDDTVELIQLAISAKSMLPVEIVYKFDNDMVSIKILSFEQLTSSINLYNPVKYADYEIIDFR